MDTKSSVYSFIINGWDGCERYNPEDDGDFIGLPYPYIVPTRKGMFQEMYYWDTYFACEGLLLCEREELAKSCADNMAFLINKFGFVPNGNRTPFLTRSQPPYFCMLVRAVFEKTKDEKWLEEIYPVIEKEYAFWQENRMSPVGLNHYGATGIDEENAAGVYEYMKKRFPVGELIKNYKDVIDFTENFVAECESGWDFNPRFGLKCKTYAPADLNSNLFVYEKTMASFSRILKNGREDEWEKRAEKRKELINKYLWNGEFYSDYDYVNEKQSGVYSAAAFHPLWAGAADADRAKSVISNIGKIEFEYGIAACEKLDNALNFQWAYPNAWAPLQFITVFGLSKYGYTEAALRISDKYTSSIERIFEATGNLWEKYNAADGTINVVNEYEMPDMLGWTAGVYLSLKRFAEENG